MLKKFKDCVKRKIVLIAIGIAIALLAIIAVIAVIANKGRVQRKILLHQIVNLLVR